MLAPARIPVAEGKKMENIPKKLPSGPRQSGTKFWTKMSPGKTRTGQRDQGVAGGSAGSSSQSSQGANLHPGEQDSRQRHIHTSVIEEAFGSLVLRRGDQCTHQVVSKGNHDDEEEENLGLGVKSEVRGACPAENCLILGSLDPLFTH